MKIAATADIHLGDYSYPIRNHIIKSMAQIADIVEEEKPDVFIIAGDLFRSKSPPVRDIAEMVKFLRRARSTSRVIIVAGNHDIIDNETTVLDIFTGVTTVKKPKMIDGIACFPWVVYRDETMIKATIALLENSSGILVAHCTAMDAKFPNNMPTTIGSDIVWPSSVFDNFSWAILGHIHKPQNVTENAFYVGSPCPVSFSETEDKSIVILDGKEMRRIPINTPRFITVNDTSDVPGYNYFVKLTSPPETPPDCLWYTVQYKAKATRIERRAGYGITPRDAVLQYLKDNDYDANIIDLYDTLRGEK